MLAAIAIIVFGILLGVVVLLGVPVEIVFTIRSDETSQNDAAVVLLFGILRIPLRMRSGKKPREKIVNKNASKTKRRGGRKAFALVRNANLRRRFLRYIRRLVRAIKIKTLDVRVRLGLDDPADTGRLWGVVGPLASLFAGLRGVNIRIEPEFSEEVFSLQSQGRIRVIPLQILLISLFFFLSPQVIRMLALKS